MFQSDRRPAKRTSEREHVEFGERGRFTRLSGPGFIQLSRASAAQLRERTAQLRERTNQLRERTNQLRERANELHCSGSDEPDGTQQPDLKRADAHHNEPVRHAVLEGHDSAQDD